MNNTKELLKLIQENPNLPIIPMVDSEVVCDDGHCWWQGAFKRCEVTEWVCITMWGEERFFTRDDQDYIEEYFADQLIEGDDEFELPDDAIDKIAHDAAEALDWKKAIVVYIGTVKE